MLPRLVPEILSQCAFCDGAAAAAAGIGDSRSLMIISTAMMMMKMEVELIISDRRDAVNQIHQDPGKWVLTGDMVATAI